MVFTWRCNFVVYCTALHHTWLFISVYSMLITLLLCAVVTSFSRLCTIMLLVMLLLCCLPLCCCCCLSAIIFLTLMLLAPHNSRCAREDYSEYRGFWQESLETRRDGCKRPSPTLRWFDTSLFILHSSLKGHCHIFIVERSFVRRAAVGWWLLKQPIAIRHTKVTRNENVKVLP